MATPYEAALADATAPTVSTSWTNHNERFDIPAVNNEQRPILQAWLSSLNSAVATGAAPWRAIQSNWISFLSATSNSPSAVLSSFGGLGTASAADVNRRFLVERCQRQAVEHAVWRNFDQTAKGLVGKWSYRVRVALGRFVESNGEIPIASIMGDFWTQSRFKSVWAAMVCFLVYCKGRNYSLEQMGLRLSDRIENDLHSIIESSHPECPRPPTHNEFMTEFGIEELIDRALTDRSASPATNPVIWWTVVLVRSSLETGPDDFISRGRFDSNILPMDLDIAQRLEGIFRFARLHFLGSAADMWQPDPKELRDEVERDLDSHEERNRDTFVWKCFLAHLERTFTAYLGQQGGTPVSHIVLLQEQLRALESV